MTKKEETVKGKEEQGKKNIATDSENKGTGKKDKNQNKKTQKKSSGKEKKANLKELEEKINELSDKYLRLSAEFENYRKRTLKERMELIKNAGEDTIINFLPVMDNIDRAKKSVDDAKDIEAVKEGINLIYKSLKDFLTERGVSEIQATGEDFDTDLHEALTKIPAPEESLKGKVIDVIEKGYKLNDKVLRFAKVVVGE